jgi:hypothetical protein
VKRFALVACVLAGCLSNPPGGPGVHDLSDDNFVDMARNTTSCAGGGSSCASGNPGECNAGTTTCSGTLAMCTPNSMVQDCYDGPAGTENVGICKSGTQSCIGTLGMCEGEVLPAMIEDCTNDLDDDCDGQVNNGCADSISLGMPIMVAPLAPTTPPMNANQLPPAASRCPQGDFIYELEVLVDDPNLQIAGLQYYCATPTLTQTTGTNIYTLGMTPITPAPYDAFANAAASSPTSSIAVPCGTTGLQTIFGVSGKYDSGGYTAALADCGTAIATWNMDNTITITVTAHATQTGKDFGLSGTQVAWSCAANEVMVGFYGALSASMDQLQPICEALTPVYKL